MQRHTEKEATSRQRQKLELYVYKPRKAKDCQHSPEARGEDWSEFSPVRLRGAAVPCEDLWPAAAPVALPTSLVPSLQAFSSQLLSALCPLPSPLQGYAVGPAFIKASAVFWSPGHVIKEKLCRQI